MISFGKAISYGVESINENGITLRFIKVTKKSTKYVVYDTIYAPFD